MSEHDQLAEALREQLHAVVANLYPSPELLASVAAIPGAAAARPRLRDRLTRRSAALAVPVPIAGIVAAIVFAFSGASPSASLGSRITRLPGGAVRVPHAMLYHPAAANAQLREHDVHNIVVVPMTASCPDRDWTYIAGPPGHASATLFTPRTIARGYTAVLAERNVTPDEDLLAITRVLGRVPVCASTHGWGAGMATYRSWPAPQHR